MVDKSNVEFLYFLFGCLFTLCWMPLLSSFSLNGKYKELLRYTKNLIELQEGVVTVADLALRAEVSPAKASKFLKNLALQLEIEPEVNETGTIYYVFNTGKTISHQRRLGEHS